MYSKPIFRKQMLVGGVCKEQPNFLLGNEQQESDKALLVTVTGELSILCQGDTWHRCHLQTASLSQHTSSPRREARGQAPSLSWWLFGLVFVWFCLFGLVFCVFFF